MAEATVSDLPNDELDALYEGVMNCEPMIPCDQVEAIADVLEDQGKMGRPWRLTAVLASKGGDFFQQVATDAEKAKALAQTVHPLNDFAKMLREVADMADAVSARVAVAGCNHESFNEWVDSSE